MVIVEDLCRLGEADAVLLLVLPSLLGIPFEYPAPRVEEQPKFTLSGPLKRDVGQLPVHSMTWSA